LSRNQTKVIAENTIVRSAAQNLKIIHASNLIGSIKYFILSGSFNGMSSNQFLRLFGSTIAERVLTDNYHKPIRVNETINIHQGGPFCLGGQL
jgi:hypothetical protein